jgi:hypothetical protein
VHAAIALAALISVPVLSPLSPLHPDTLRDLDVAGHCVHHGQCLTSGPPTSAIGIMHGGLWPHVLALVQFTHLSMKAFQMAVCVSFVMATLLLAAAVAQLLDRRAAALAAASYLGGLLLMGDHVVLWNPTVSPIPMVLTTIATMLLARDGKTRWALIGGFWLALAIESHVQAAVLIFVVLPAALLWARRPAIAVLGAAAVCALVLLVGSASAFSEAFFRVGRSVAWVHALLPVAGVVACIFARRFARKTERARVVQVLALYVAFFVVGVVAVELLVPAAFVQARYLHVVMPAACALSSYVLISAASRSQHAVRVAGWLAPAVWVLPVLAALWLSRKPAFSTWMLADIETIMREAKLPSRPDRPRSWLDVADCRYMANALQVLGDTPSSTLDDPLMVWRISEPRGMWPSLSGLGGMRVVLDGGETVLVSPLRSWLDRQAATLCLAIPPGGEHCVTFGASDWQNAAARSRSFVAFADRGLAPIMRAPRFRATYRFTVRVHGDDLARWFGVIPSSDDPCGWQMEGTGDQADAGHQRVERSADGTAAVRAFKDFADDACAVREIVSISPPCLLESREAESALRAATSPHAIGVR